MGYKKKNPKVTGLKMKDFPQDFEFLANIVGKCIFRKDSAHNSISMLQLQIMSAIIMEVKINYSEELFGRLSKWFKDVERRNNDNKSILKMYFRMFISIMLQKRLRQHLKEKDGEPLNGSKKIIKRLFDN